MSSRSTALTALTEQPDDVNDELAEILEGLSRPHKELSPKFFYDDRGSALFDHITRLPEYYLTNTEMAIMRKHVGEISELIGPQASLIEFGSGSSMKIRVLLENIRDLAAYVPVDISKEHLVAAADALAEDFPEVEILPVAADFTHPFELPNPKVMPVRNVVYFPGSTIGNFSPEAAQDLLGVMYVEAGENGALLIGVDLRKDRDIIERAYNDGAGVTAEFNLNMLRRINKEFGADFDLDRFHHLAFYNPAHGRIEMHLVSDRDQEVHIDGETIRFVKDETILTEHSHKYTLEGFEKMAEKAGFTVDRVWTDPDELFSVQYCRRT